MFKVNKIFKIYIVFTLFIFVGYAESYGNPWTINKNEIYIRSSIFSLQSNHRFNFNSRKQIFSNNGFTKVYGMFFDISYGITDKLNLNAVIPLIGYDFRDTFNKIAGNGLGDVKTFIKYKFLEKKIASSFEFGIKFPSPTNSGSFTDVQIGEGQYDIEGVASIGYQPSRIFSFLNLDFGFRFRKKNKSKMSKPGDEFLFRFENGILLRKSLLLSTGIEGFSGKKTEEFGIRFTNSERRLFSFSVNLVKGITPKTGIMLNLNVPFAGKNYNAGSLIGIGFFFYKGKYININQKINLPSVTCQSVCSI